MQLFFIRFYYFWIKEFKSKYNGLRPNKATTSPQYCNKEVGKRNKQYILGTRQGLLLSTYNSIYYDVLLVFGYFKINFLFC